MTSAWDQLEQMLTCAICLDKFKNPRLLPCQHSFCGDACMEGLVDYARRQIKCPECRAEHRIPYQGITSLPSNVTLIRFLELHAKITGEEPEPVPTFMEKCSVCGEKIEGVQRCSHCDKKVCPECKEAHIDLLKREINRVNGQSKRCLSKIEEFNETLVKSGERLDLNRRDVIRDIEDCCGRIINDLQIKQRKLIDEVNKFTESEHKTIERLKVAIADELVTLKSNAQLADDKIAGPKYQWNDQELSEIKDIYVRSMEFVRSFDPEIGDFSRKMRFTLSHDYDAIRKKIVSADSSLGELKFAETAASQIASSLQCCNLATGKVALEFCGPASGAHAASIASSMGAGGYSLAHSNSNSNLSSEFLGLTQNALVRSQSDHRLASQFQQKLRAQEASRARQNKAAGLENDPPAAESGSHFKSAFMRRREKERLQCGYQDSGGDDDGSSSETLYDTVGGTGRTVRFFDQPPNGTDYLAEAGGEAQRRSAPKLFDCNEVEHAPLSGIPKLDDCPYLQTRLHQIVVRAAADKRHVEEEDKRDKDLVESARLAMSKVVEKAAVAQYQQGEDEIDRQKRANRQEDSTTGVTAGDSIPAPESRRHESNQQISRPLTGTTSFSSPLVERPPVNVPTLPATSSTPAVPSTLGRRGLYGQAMSERSRLQLSSALQDSSSSVRRPRVTASIVADDDDDGDYVAIGSQGLSRSSGIARLTSARDLAGGGSTSYTTRGGVSPGSWYRSSRTDGELDADSDATETKSRRISTYSRVSNSSSGRQELSDSPDSENENENVDGASLSNSQKPLPSAMSKLLDRSAQIRRDSKEQRDRGDSPQRTLRSSNYAPSSGIPSSTRRRLTYQRSHSSDGEVASKTGRSFDEYRPALGENSRNSASKPAGNYGVDRKTHTRDATGENEPSSGAMRDYQGRYLARSRTSAALSDRNGLRSQEASDPSSKGSNDRPESPRSYLGSRDRFAKSTSSTAKSSDVNSSSVASPYNRGGTSAGAQIATTTPKTNTIGNLGQFRHRLTSPANFKDNSPFVDLDDDDDDWHN